ncbi:hypothetical protein DPMN_014351 [Dreissena polymorpha]|uniref:Uncharacterized protein n=1 Tax=Dreissena polymorpha TaxID=45954 RepID=A0A9D4N9J8_DREPO|nr:hypothetical protein DPMN_014351 [Dreissena polymorpha]
MSDLDYTARKFQEVSFGLLLLPVICGILEAYCNSNSEDVGCLGTCSGALFLLYPVAGLCSLTGCIIIKIKFSESSIGSSLNYCVASGLEIIILTAIIIAVICYIRRRPSHPSNEQTTTMSTGQLTTASPVEPVSFVSIHA